jgi:hypothetical protein
VCSVVKGIPKYNVAKGSRKLTVLTMLSGSMSDGWCCGKLCVQVYVLIVVHEIWVGAGYWSYCEQCDRLEKEGIGCVIVLVA